MKDSDRQVMTHFQIPNIDSIFDKLGKAQNFSTLDLTKGVHEILVDNK